MEITIGQVSAVINFGALIVQFTLPLAIVLILVGYIDNENNAVTWSVISRSLQASTWPTLLSSDSVSSTGVKTRVVVISFLSTIGLLLLAIAGVVTPLGLGDEIAESHTVPVPFAYVQDTSSFGMGTASRDGYHLNRICGYFMAFNCPGAVNGGFVYTRNSTGEYLNGTDDAYLDSRLPENVTEVFTSALRGKGETISSVLDVQFRNWRNVKDSDAPGGVPFDNGAERTEGDFSLLQQLVLNDGYELVEGLVVDMRDGGVGFRNHTAPTVGTYGARWKERLLWIEPVTECTNNNLTIDFTVPASYLRVQNATLRDLGGIAEAQREYPTFERDNAQNDPQLAQRAFKGGWITNMMAASYLNITSRTKGVGKSFNLSNSYGSSPVALKTRGIGISNLDGGFFDSSYELSTNFTSANTVCKGFGGADIANITNIAVSCSTILGAARRVDGNTNGLRFDPGSNWTIPVYTCATALKASVKEVEFLLNGTMELSNIQITSVSPVSYSSAESMPLWAMERSELSISDIDPLWGIVEDRYENSPNLFTIRRDHFWLPASTATVISSVSSLAGAHVPAAALEYALSLGSTFEGMYTGETSLALFTKWQKLSESAETTKKIINLIWTDIMANAVTGTRSALTYQSDSTGNNLGMISVITYARRITYNLLYAIPAIIILIMWLVICAIAFFLLLSTRVTFPLLKQLVNQTSTGRTVTNIVYPDLCTPDAPTSVWIKTAGSKPIGLITLEDTEQSSGDPDDIPLKKVQQQVGGRGDSDIERDERPVLTVRTGTGFRFGEVKADEKTPVSAVFKER